MTAPEHIHPEAEPGSGLSAERDVHPNPSRYFTRAIFRRDMRGVHCVSVIRAVIKQRAPGHHSMKNFRIPQLFGEPPFGGDDTSGPLIRMTVHHH